MEIIEAKPQHFPEIEALIHKVWEPTYRHIVPHRQIQLMEERMHSIAAYAQQVKDGHRFYVAVEKEQILGFISFYLQNGGVKIPKLYVDTQISKRGIGKALLESVRLFSENNRLKFIELNVNRYNKALYFYRRYGFYITKSVDIPWDEFWLNDYVMRLEL